ncbi:uncharacterized protein ZBAI_00526 [Zygosaccharomyces bailii ISA1307]|nr:uncharacterized protein ZBAI_00526 [Zygosaccharomyces bailii ISA1307]
MLCSQVGHTFLQVSEELECADQGTNLASSSLTTPLVNVLTFLHPLEAGTNATGSAGKALEPLRPLQVLVYSMTPIPFAVLHIRGEHTLTHSVARLILLHIVYQIANYGRRLRAEPRRECSMYLWEVTDPLLKQQEFFAWD